MVAYAYRDSSRTDTLQAKDAKHSDKSATFYCPNPDCDAELTICNLGEHAYFSAKPSKPHITYCEHASHANNYHRYDEASFDFEKMLAGLLIPTLGNPPTTQSQSNTARKSSQTTSFSSIRTLRMLYILCKNKQINDEYNGNIIGRMLLDNRSQPIFFKKGVFGNAVIECISWKYDETKHEIWARLQNQSYTFALKFEHTDLYQNIKQLIQKHAPATYGFKNVQLVIAGTWFKYQNKFNHFETIIASKKQIIAV